MLKKIRNFSICQNKKENSQPSRNTRKLLKIKKALRFSVSFKKNFRKLISILDLPFFFYKKLQLMIKSRFSVKI
jgi:hypothetical protein